jgi:SWI/SNF-related matrix-associated actin-dependent regulator 1 of chromatin subfamily A
MTVIAGVPRFVLDCPITKQDFAMEAGLRRDSSAHHWYTTDVKVAARLRNFAEGPLRDRLNALAAESALKPTLSFERGLYVFRADRELAEVARNAEFFRNPDTEHWYTTDPHYAMRLSEYGDENCHAQIRASLAEMDEMLTASRALDAEIEVPAPPGRNYFPHQRAAVAYAKRVLRLGDTSLNGDAVPGVLIGDEMRVGKTPSAIGIINLGGEAFKKILIVCPAGVKLGWYRELQAWLTTKRKILIADGATSAWKFEAADISIVNFDILKDHAEWERRTSRDKRAVLKSAGRLDLPWDLVIIDEAHLLKNAAALRSIVGYALLERARRKLCLTGTPITSWIEDLYPLLHALDPISWPTLNRFKARYGSGKDARNLDELKRRLRSTIMCRRLLREVQPGLPPKIREVLEFSADDAATQRAVQREAAAWERQEERLIALQAAAELAKASDDARTHTEASRLLGEGKRIAFNETARLRHETALVKVPYVVAHVRNLIEDPGYKVVVGAWHTDVIEKLAASFGNRAVTVTGAVSADLKVVDGRDTSDRMQRVDRFLEDPICQVFFGQLIAAGMGLNLSSGSHIVCAELWYVPWVLQQFEARCEHPTKQTSIFVQHAVLAGSIDARIARALVEKQALIDQALDGVSQAEDVSLVDEPATKSLTRAAIEREAEKLTVTEIAAIHRALKTLSGMNQVDSTIARALTGYSVLSARQAVLGRGIILKYKSKQ